MRILAVAGPNDIVFDRQGGFWFTDFGKSRARDTDRGGVYYAHPDGSLIREVVFPMYFPNGIGLSPREDRLFVSETHSNRVWAFDVPEPGQIAPRGLLNGGELICAPGGYQGFGSLAVEESGTVCVGMLHKGGITVIDPVALEFLQFQMPDPTTTNICFGGRDMRSAVVTLSGTGRLIRANWPTRIAAELRCMIDSSVGPKSVALGGTQIGS